MSTSYEDTSISNNIMMDLAGQDASSLKCALCYGEWHLQNAVQFSNPKHRNNFFIQTQQVADDDAQPATVTICGKQENPTSDTLEMHAGSVDHLPTTVLV